MTEWVCVDVLHEYTCVFRRKTSELDSDSIPILLNKCFFGWNGLFFSFVNGDNFPSWFYSLSFFFFIEVQLIYKIVLVSGVRQSDSDICTYTHIWGLFGSSAGKESACKAGDLGLIPGLGRSPGGGHGNPLQYSCLENPCGQRSLAGYSPWGHKVLDTTDWLSTQYIHIFLFHSFPL